ncbi:MAG TPA: bacterial transcriptional activator domain-containing protein [Acidimicrobiales bacterium]|nr:bacterial transcriptional activator domain-containing protein [Acidimicrobiales bacterium]
MGGNGNFDAPRVAAGGGARGRATGAGTDGRARWVQGARVQGARVHLAPEEWTRLVLRELACRVRDRDGGVGHREADPGAAGRPVVWELRSDEIVAGCEDGPAGPRPHGATGAQPPARLVVRFDELPRSAEPGGLLRELPDAALATAAVDHERRVLVDLVAARVTTVAGGLQDRDAWTGRAAVELAERRFADFGQLLVVGLPHLAAHLPRGADVGFVDDLAELEGLLLTRGPAAPRGWAGAGSADTLARTTVLVVGAAATADATRLDRLVAAIAESGEASTAGPGPLALLVGAAWPGGRCRIEVAAGGRHGVVRVPGAREPVHRAPARRSGAPAGVEAAPSEAEAARPAGVEVAVLGRVEVRGVEGSLDRRPKLTELVVYLALHPRGATTTAWSTALWPRRMVPPQTVSNRLSEARRLLGFASDDRPRLRRVGDAHVLAEVSTDWARFQELARAEDTASWRSALSLVRGRPFEDLPSGLWTALECTAVEIERAVTSCALRCGERLLAGGDADGAVWAAHQGLRAAPWDERLHRLLMVTADATGNRAGVDATLRHLALVLEVDGDPLRHVHPETAALYEQLSGRVASPG